MDIQQIPTNNARAFILRSLAIIDWLAFNYTESCSPPAKFLGWIPQFDQPKHFVALAIFGFLASAISQKLRLMLSILLFSDPLPVITPHGIINESQKQLVHGRIVGIPSTRRFKHCNIFISADHFLTTKSKEQKIILNAACGSLT